MALILIIDDEPSVRLSIKSYLQDLDHDVLEAAGGTEGLDLFNKQNPDLLLVDIRMHDIDGLEVLTNVTHTAPLTPVIMLSGAGIISDVVEALRKGAWNYLTKPIEDMIVLKHSVEQALERSRLLRENKSYQLHLESEVAKRTRDLDSLVNNLPIGLYRIKTGLQDVINMANPAIANMFGYLSTESFCKNTTFEQLFVNQNDAKNLRDKLNKSEAPLTQEISLKRLDGSHFWGEITTYPVFDEKGCHEFIDGAIEDISIRKEAEVAIHRQAFYDSLTGLPNRALLLEHLKHQITLAKRQKLFAAVLFLDLDHFKNLNDALGHAAGDELLKKVAIRLKDQVRSIDTVSRLGGDEFVVLLSMHTHQFEDAGFQANHIAENIRKVIAQPFSIFDHSYQLTVSIGIVVFPSENGNDNPQDILKYADTAMYSSKENGRDTIKFFQTHMNEAAEFRLQIESELHAALNDKRFIIHYQPLVDHKGNLLGAECLIRLKHTNGHIIPPTQFISVAEEMGLIREISLWILDESCQQLKYWDNKYAIKNLHLAINISARHFYRPEFVDDIIQAVSRREIEPNRLVLEITEGILLHDIDEAIEKMQTLKSLGFRFAIDDFGTGYSSLAYLKKLPLDILKIDRSFVMDITTDKDALTIAETIISMSTHLGLEIVAEGIETVAQLDLLHDRACQVFQGFYFSKPLSADDFSKYIEN